MPLKWVKPEVFMSYNGLKIYYTYNNDSYEDISSYWFATNAEEDGEYEFDIRVLAEKLHMDLGGAKYQKAIIRSAMNLGFIKFPENE